MRPYEVMIILDPALSEDAVGSVIDRCAELIRSRGGTTGQIDRWGKRRLAYEVAHQREGYYVLVEATAEPAVMAEVERVLHLADEVMRHKVVRLPDRVAGRPRPSAPSGPDGGAPAPVAAEAATATSTVNGV